MWPEDLTLTDTSEEFAAYLLEKDSRLAARDIWLSAENTRSVMVSHSAGPHV